MDRDRKDNFMGIFHAANVFASKESRGESALNG